MILQLFFTTQISCKTHKWRTLEKSRQQCALPSPGTTLPAAGNLASRCPDATAKMDVSVLTYGDSSANHGRYFTDHPSSSAKTQTPRCLPARYHATYVGCRLRRLIQEQTLLAQSAGRWPFSRQNQFELSVITGEVNN